MIKISVLGLGKLGLCMAATMAQRGFEVLGVDINKNTVDDIKAGNIPVKEPGLVLGDLRATTDYREAVDTDISFIIVPTPSLPDGSFSNEHLFRCLELSRIAGKNHLFVIGSTVTPGTCTLIKSLIDQPFCYNPQFIALGNVVSGLLEPDLVLIGESDKEAGDRLEDFYLGYNTNEPPIFRMSPISAELTKIALNSYITMKISFTNQMRLIAQKYDADLEQILYAVGSDSRIGHKYLRPGLNYGGPCFPRDNRLLEHAAKFAGVTAYLSRAADEVNNLTKAWLVEQALNIVRPGDPVLILGMAYRPGTGITEESAGVCLAKALEKLGCKVLVHDYMASDEGFRWVNEEELPLVHVKATFICCPWPDYDSIELPKGTQLFDPWHIRK